MRILTFGAFALLLFPVEIQAQSTAMPHIAVHVPPRNRGGIVGSLSGNANYTSTFSGTSMRPSVVQLYGLSYDGSCKARSLGTWSPQPLPLSEYDAAKVSGPIIEGCNPDANDCEDNYGCANPFIAGLWKTLGFSEVDSLEPLSGLRSVWCGAPIWTDLGRYRPGYPNSDGPLQPHMLYVDTGSHTGSYGMTFQMNFSSDWGDPIYLIGGGGGAIDPIGVDWVKVDQIIAGGQPSGSRLLVSWAGSFTSGRTVVIGPSTLRLTGDIPVSFPMTRTMTINNIPAEHRALYFIFNPNEVISTQDAGWSWGYGQFIDDLHVSDNGFKYVDAGPSPGCTDSLGTALSCTGTTLDVSSRTRSGGMDCFALRTGSDLLNEDFCSPEKSLATEKIWTVVNPTVPTGVTAGLEQCTFPVPPGTTSLAGSWRHYLDLPEGAGYIQVAEYRMYKGGAWSTWRNTNPSGAVRTGTERAWVTETDELTDAAQADSVQMRFWIKCIPALAAGGQCQPISVGVYYDDFGLWAFTGGVPAPTFGLFPGTLAQTTFVDGTMTGVNCPVAAPCWPGPRGTALGPANGGIGDNVNSPVGDSMVVFLRSAFRRNGMGLNWRFGYDKTAVSTGIVHTNASYVGVFGEPRMIYRLFDPLTKTWGPFDSTALDADDVRVSPTDTSLVQNAFRMDWPPRDKAGLNLPGGFTINGIGAYNSLAFLPRGTRMQYYVKAVDIQGNVAYQFQSDAAAYEVEDLPTLPGSLLKAPDIMEFVVLPRAYAPGSVGSQLAGRTTTPILNLDGSYTAWSFGMDPVTQAFRGLGVRADRYRLQQAPGYGANVGGHELTAAPDNQKPRRLGNHFPNMTEYAIRESLSTWYRILIQSSHLRTGTLDDEADARLITEWWSSPTSGSNGGDRCILVTGDDYFNAMLNANALDPSPRRTALAENVFGVDVAGGAWNGTGSVFHPMIDDRFANPVAGPVLANGYTYPADGGCPDPNRFDALTKIPAVDAQNSALYPVVGGITHVAAVATHSEKDSVTDLDRNKALGYGFSIQFARKAGIPTSSPNYVHSGVLERMRVLYKFLASCRGARSGAPGDTAKCWPCPTDANLTGNWNTLPGFQSGQYGPLYPIQDAATITAVGAEPPGAPGFRNVLGQNRPNPFNPVTVIPYATALPGKVFIRIYGVGGRLVRTIESGHRPAGSHIARWDGRLQSGLEAGSGVYFYRIEYPGGGVSSKKMILLR